MKSSLGSVSSGASREESLVASVERTSAKDEPGPASRGKRSGAVATMGARFADLLGSELSSAAANDASPPCEPAPVEDEKKDDAHDKEAAIEPDARALPLANEAPFGTPFAWPTEALVDVKRAVVASAGAETGGKLELRDVAARTAGSVTAAEPGTWSARVPGAAPQQSATAHTSTSWDGAQHPADVATPGAIGTPRARASSEPIGAPAGPADMRVAPTASAKEGPRTATVEAKAWQAVRDSNAGAAVREPSAGRDVREPSAERVMHEPSAERAVDEPSAERAVHEPSGARDVREPSAERAVREPSGARDVREPSAERAVREPSAERAVREPGAGSLTRATTVLEHDAAPVAPGPIAAPTSRDRIADRPAAPSARGAQTASDGSSAPAAREPNVAQWLLGRAATPVELDPNARSAQPLLAEDLPSAALGPDPLPLPIGFPPPVATPTGAPLTPGASHVTPMTTARSPATITVTPTAKRSAPVAPRSADREQVAPRPLAFATGSAPARPARGSSREPMNDPAAPANDAPSPAADLPIAAAMTPFTPPVIVPPDVSALALGVTPATAAKLRGAAALAGGADGDATANAIRNAEAVGHRRVLAGEAQGSLSIEELGRFEVSARTSEDGRVDVHVRADRREGAALLEHHAAALRADVRIDVPRAFVAVEDASHGAARDASNAGSGAQARSNGRESGGRDDRAPGDPRERTSREPMVTAASALPANAARARVKVVL